MEELKELEESAGPEMLEESSEGGLGENEGVLESEKWEESETVEESKKLEDSKDREGLLRR